MGSDPAAILVNFLLALTPIVMIIALIYYAITSLHKRNW